ncbi:MAG: DNA polymerase III subunit gamma/tau [Actinomycetota bacterium]
MYQALYRKYRPQSFEDVVGQGHVTSTLAREVVEGRIAHAYLFAGPRGTGKTTTARILAKSLNCEQRRPNGSPDNICGSCAAITDGSSLDVLELDAASHNSVEDIRDMRLSVTTVASAANARRVYILDEAHMLSKAAGNALLKTLEEPPEHVIFVLCTTEPYKLLDTIRSRTQRFDFHPVGVDGLAAHLARVADTENYKTDLPALIALARHAVGSVRDGLSLLEQVAALGGGAVDLSGVRRTLGLAGTEAYGRLADAVAEGDARAGLELVAELAADGVDLRRFVGEAIGYFRGVFLAHYAPNLFEIADEPAETLDAWRRTAQEVGAGDVLRAVDLLGEALIKLREGREERLMVELAVIRLTRPETSADPEALLARMERLERRDDLPVRDALDDGRRLPEVVSEHARPVVDSPVGGSLVRSGGSPEAGTLTLDRLNEIWPALYGGLRQVLGARRWALFREATPEGVEGDLIVLQVGQDFHLEGLQRDPAVTPLVATQASDLLGRQVRVEFRKTGAPAQVEPSEESFELDKERLFEAPDDLTDPTALLARELGATLVEEGSQDPR